MGAFYAPHRGGNPQQLTLQQVLIEYSELYSVLNRPEFFDNVFVIFFIDIRDNVPDALIGFQVLTHYVNTVGSQNLIDTSQNTGHVAVDVN